MLKRFLATPAEGVLGIRSPAFLLLVCAFWLAVLAGIRPLMLPDEGRYVGVAEGEEVSDEDFRTRFAALYAEFETLTAEAHKLEKVIAKNAAGVLG